jgi:hypothetical protein
MIKKGAENILKYNRNSVHVECASLSDVGNNRGGGDWNRFKITQTVPEQHTGMGEIKDCKKTAILGTAHKLREVLM